MPASFAMCPEDVGVVGVAVQVESGPLPRRDVPLAVGAPVEVRPRVTAALALDHPSRPQVRSVIGLELEGFEFVESRS